MSVVKKHCFVYVSFPETHIGHNWTRTQEDGDIFYMLIGNATVLISISWVKLGKKSYLWYRMSFSLFNQISKFKEINNKMSNHSIKLSL